MRDYKKYEVWKDAHSLTLFVYKEVIQLLPSSEQYALTSQLKRAVYSIAMNIAEGCGRNTDKDFVHFLDMALGLVHEVEYCVLLLKDLEYINSEIFDKINLLLSPLKGKLINLIKTIRQ